MFNALADISEERKRYLKGVGRFFYINLKEAIDVSRDLKKANLFLGELRKSFVSQGEKDYLRTLLTERQFTDLKRLVEAVKSQKIVTPLIEGVAYDGKNNSRRELSTYEKQARERILKDRQSLIDCLNLSKLDDITCEYDLESFGKCDLWVRADSIGYPIEIKDEQADQRVVGQISKYIKGSIRLMNLGWYEWVIGVVIAPSFTTNTLNELKAMEVRPLRIELTQDGYSLEEL